MSGPFDRTAAGDAAEPTVPTAPAADDAAEQAAFEVESDIVELEDQLDADTALVDDVSLRLLSLESALAERTADVQRVHAEYANYRKRVERDREQVRDNALADLLGQLLTVLDDVDRADSHGELVGGFRSVGEGLRATVAKLGLERYAQAGDPFDPAVHEALTHLLSPDVTQATCVEVFQPGYRLGPRVVRPARVAVAEPSGQA